MVHLYVAFSEEYSCIHQGECVFASIEQFSTVSEIIRDCFGFALLFAVIGPEKLVLSFQPIRYKLKSIVT